MSSGESDAIRNAAMLHNKVKKPRKLVYVTDEDTGDFAAIYLDGRLLVDAVAWELDAYQVMLILQNEELLQGVEVSRRTLLFDTRVEFPDFLEE